MDESNQHFEKWSETYDHSLLQHIFFDRLQHAALVLVPAADPLEDILDVGCGTGRLLRKARARWPQARLYGVDLSEGMIAQARRRLPEAHFYVAPAEKIPLPDHSIDLAFSTVSFHHWNDQQAGLGEIARVMRPGGRFILADSDFPLHGNAIRRQTIGGMFQRAGIQPAAIKTIFLPFLVAVIGKKTPA